MEANIKKLIPCIEENFITFPLVDEGIYIPSVNVGFYTTKEIVYDELHVLENFIDKPSYIVIFVNQDIPKRKKTERYLSFGVSYVEGTEQKDIYLDKLIDIAYLLIRNLKK